MTEKLFAANQKNPGRERRGAASDRSRRGELPSGTARRNAVPYPKAAPPPPLPDMYEKNFSITIVPYLRPVWHIQFQETAAGKAKGSGFPRKSDPRLSKKWFARKSCTKVVKCMPAGSGHGFV